MPFYMDRHYVEGATAHAVAVAHTATLAGQDRYRVRVLDLLVRRCPVHGLLSGRLAGQGDRQASP